MTALRMYLCALLAAILAIPTLLVVLPILLAWYPVIMLWPDRQLAKAKQADEAAQAEAIDRLKAALLAARVAKPGWNKEMN
jgi:predicted tellurium resistance membrane protein TerC